MQDNISELLSFIDPSMLNYTEWLNVGMALKHEGHSCSEWDCWSQRDSARYHAGECETKWKGFNGSATPVTGGTIFQMACDFGYTPPTSRTDEAMSWDDEIAGDKFKVLEGVEVQPLRIPADWHPREQIIKYLETLFEPDEYVGYVTDCWQNSKGKFLPSKGNYDRTAAQLIDELSRLSSDDIGAVFGDYNKEVGAWIRFNPLDGQGVKNENVTDFRFALVESDSIDIETQNSIIRALELPVAALVYSGGKSVHAIVRIDADNAKDYADRVKYLYKVCEENGFKTDRQNKNPSRLSRLPGVTRGERKQYLLDTNIGKESWAEWFEYIESIHDDLPEIECFADIADNLPKLSPELISGVLRQGHKMLISGGSKASKSFALIELTIAIAEGKSWLGFGCAKGKVLYVNLELDKPSCFHRFADVYKALGYPKTDSIKNIDIWNLRGNSCPMDRLAPKLIRRAAKKNYIAIIIDPIYKVLTGDENSAEQMAKFCNGFDKICTELGCAVIYCHHHSKGNQGQKKSMDRASGSGVFARDPDAMLDIIELELDKNVERLLETKTKCKHFEEYLRRFHPQDFDEICSQDDLQSAAVMAELAEKYLPRASFERANEQIAAELSKDRSALRIEGILREFPRIQPVNCWFNYPVHTLDDSGILADIDTDYNSKNSNWRKNFSQKKTPEEKEEIKKQKFETAFYSLQSFYEDNKVPLKDLAEQVGRGERTVRGWIENDFEEYTIKKGKVVKIE